jgi:flagellum-specific peptidoglycan hydrolase FlgJ
LLKRSQLEFLQEVVGPALQSERDYRIPASITIAQCILESAGKVNGTWTWGASWLFREANNPFGIKHRHHGGEEAYEECSVKTSEVENGKLEKQRAIFQRFSDLASAFGAHALLFLTLPRYQPAIRVRDDWQKFAVALMECGYSTDRPELCQEVGCIHYAGKLINLVNHYRLNDSRALAWYAMGEDPGSKNSER